MINISLDSRHSIRSKKREQDQNTTRLDHTTGQVRLKIFDEIILFFL